MRRRNIQRASLLLLLASSSCIADNEAPPGEGEGEGEGEVPLGVLVVTAIECEFGEVPLGALRVCNIGISNAGVRDIELLGYTVTAANDVFELPVAPVGTIPPSAAAVVRVLARPNALGPVTSMLVIDLAGVVEPRLTIPLSVTGMLGATCVARVKSVNGVEVALGSTPAIAPTDDVVLSLDASEAGTSAAISSYQWTLLGRPSGSTVTLTTPTAADTAFIYAAADYGLDLAGTYQVRGFVDYGNGEVSCDLELNAVPSAPFLVQLSWDTPNGDLDLHVRRDADALCSASDCYRLTCENGGVDWGGNAVSPRLEDADEVGFGPESISVAAPQDGTYRIAVHGRTVPQESVATVRVFLDGHLAFESSAPMAAGRTWQVASVTCAAGACVATDDGSVIDVAVCAP